MQSTVRELGPYWRLRFMVAHGLVRGGLLAVTLLAAGRGDVGLSPGPTMAQGCSVEISLDQPGNSTEVSLRERISGWAVDRAASQGTGIEAVRLALDIAPDSA